MDQNEDQINPALAALGYLYHNVHVPAFFNKLASMGIVPQDEQEAEQLRQIGDVVLEAIGAENSKQASVQAGIVGSLAADLGLLDDEAGGDLRKTADYFASRPDAVAAAEVFAKYL